jgi:hypothetical protein
VVTAHSEEGDEGCIRVIPDRVRERILFLSRDFSALAISRMPGMPDLRTLYSAIVADLAFKEQFLKANNQYHRNRRAAVADLLRRSQQTDLSRVFVELRKLKTQPMQRPEHASGEYDLTRLSDAELDDLHRILSKAVPSESGAQPLSDQTMSE